MSTKDIILRLLWSITLSSWGVLVALYLLREIR